MDFSSSLSIAFIPLSLLIVTVYILTRKPAATGAYANLPPGSFGWPLIGETLAFLNAEKFLAERMKKHSPNIFKTNIFGEPTAVICGASGNKFIFTNEQKLVDVWRTHTTQKLFGTYKTSKKESLKVPPQNTNLATTVLRTPGFLKPEALMRFTGKMDSLTRQHLNLYWENKNEIKADPLVKIYTLTLAFQFFLGLDDDDVLGWVNKLVGNFDDITIGMHSIPINFPGTVFHRASKSASIARKGIIKIVQQRREKLMNNPGLRMQDVLSHMILACDEAGKFIMSEGEIGDKLMGLLVAGYSTVAAAITFLMKYVGEKPDIYAKILQEQWEIETSKESGEALDWKDIQKMKYSWNVACEVMRLIPPIQGAFREAITDITYAGFTIPKGWKIYWSVGTTSKIAEHFKEPEDFDPSRYDGYGPAPYTYVPFGGGPRMCPGKDYAKLVILTFLHNVVKRFEWEVMCPNEKIIIEMMPIPTQGLPIRLRRH